jgi:serine/threonine protein kinase
MVKCFSSLGIGHNNLSLNTIFFNREEEIFFSPIKIQTYGENELWYSPPERDLLNSQNVYNAEYYDIWSLGCIIAELFFLPTPLFYCNDKDDKLIKLFEVIEFNLDFRLARARRFAVLR